MKKLMMVEVDVKTNSQGPPFILDNCSVLFCRFDLALHGFQNVYKI